MLVNFDDYVGTLELGGSTISVRTSKLDADGFDALLREITARCATLPFDYQSPTLIPYERTALDERDLLYHAFTYLRWAIDDASPSLLEVLAWWRAILTARCCARRSSSLFGRCAVLRRR